MKHYLISAVVAITVLLDIVKAQPGLTSCSDTDTLCDFDYKTGLRKQCIKRYVNSVGNYWGAGYKNALKNDTDLRKGFETFRCYESQDVEAIMATHNIKDSKTTVTS